MKKLKLGKLWTVVCALLAFVFVFSFAACKTDGDNNNKGLTLNSTSLTIDVGSTSPLLVTSTTTEDVVWTSSDETKVTVAGSGNGKRMATVTAVAKGTATVTAKVGESNATCTVNVVEAETISITQNGTAATSVSLSGKDATVQLAATSSRGHSIVWASDNTQIATVTEAGLVKAVATSGKANITASCSQHTDVTKTVEVVVGSGEDSAYNLKLGDENAQFGNYNSNDNPGVWVYWNQFGNVASATYEDGVVSITTSGVEEGAWWYNVQLFYTATEADKDTAGNALAAGTLYQLTFDIDTTMAGGITVNGYPVQLQEGVNHCTAYYTHGATAFSMQLGIDGVGCTITNATLKLSNIKWTVSQKVALKAPTFSITDNVITINDTNPAGSVGSYALYLYDNTGKQVGGTKVTNGATVNTGKIRPNGTYTGKLVANAASSNYISAPETTSQNATVVVNNPDNTLYNIESTGAGGAVIETGTWTYWSESWVSFQGKVNVADGKAKITFSNNTGNWYDTQLFYKIPGKNIGDTYTVELHINNVPKQGRITINGEVKTLDAGENVITLNITEADSQSIVIVFGVLNENQRQDFGALTDLEVYIA